MPLFEVDGRQHAVVRVLAFWVAEQLDDFEHVPSGLLACPIFAPSDFFSRQELKEAFCDGVVMAIAPAAHGVFQTVFTQEGRPFSARELRTLDAEWINRPGPGFRRQIAMNRACTASSDV